MDLFAVAWPYWHQFFFIIFAATAVGFGFGVLLSKNVVRMAFYLVLSLGSTAGLFFLAGAEFVGAMQLMIYVGGTLVLLIFGVMLTAQKDFINMDTHTQDWILATIVGGSLLMVLLFAAKPASTKLTEALKSVAITSAPVNCEGPLIIAILFFISIFAPILFNSGTCINLFSKIHSLILEIPLARVIKTINCACKSVGNPGYGFVERFIFFIFLLFKILILDFWVLNFTPIFFKILSSF